jgi:hypothetical protein
VIGRLATDRNRQGTSRRKVGESAGPPLFKPGGPHLARTPRQKNVRSQGWSCIQRKLVRIRQKVHGFSRQNHDQEARQNVTVLLWVSGNDFDNCGLHHYTFSRLVHAWRVNETYTSLPTKPGAVN